MYLFLCTWDRLSTNPQNLLNMHVICPDDAKVLRGVFVTILGLVFGLGTEELILRVLDIRQRSRDYQAEMEAKKKSKRKSSSAGRRKRIHTKRSLE